MTTPRANSYERHPSALLLDEYDVAEKAAIREMPARLLQAYRPVSFEKIGYQTTLQDEGELWKFIDSMQQVGTEKELAKPGGKLTADEFDRYKRITSYVLEFGRRQFSTLPIASYTTIRSLYLLRHVRYVHGDRPVRIFEVGPGCGYLAMIAMGLGYPYACTDVTQSLYILQNHLWNAFTNGKVTDLVRGGSDRAPELIAGGALRVPWWKFVTLRPEEFPKFDVVTCNHALCEIHPRAATYVIQMARRFLDAAGGTGVFMFSGWGGPIANTPMGVARIFEQNGFVLIHNDPGYEGMTVFALRGSAAAAGAHRDVDEQHGNVRRAQDAMLGVWRRLRRQPVASHVFPPVQQSNANSVSRALLEGRASDASERTYGIDAARKHYMELFGARDPVDPDREWARANWFTGDLVGAVNHVRDTWASRGPSK